MAKVDFDLIIVGAGIGGINAAYRFQTEGPKGMTYAIFEGRDTVGGTWDLFRYPGIRCDTDVYTYGFEWNPWPGKETIAMGSDIKKYIEKSAADAGIDKHIRFRHKVKEANWEPTTQCWELKMVLDGDDAKPVVYRSRYVFLGTGYYDYEEALQTTIPGIERFEGKVIHPQFWPEDYDHSDKDVVIIGSGATAVSILPAMTDKAKHVTMLQRSPTYIAPLAQHDSLCGFAFKVLSRSWAHQVSRWIWLFKTYALIFVCNLAPNFVKGVLRTAVEKRLPASIPWDPHFNPRYNPWEQRFCVDMNGDLFRALRRGKASVVTDTIQEVTARSIKLTSGAELTPDVIVTATGLKLLLGGAIQLKVDGKEVDPTSRFYWKTTMLQDLPNLFLNSSFDNVSLTLGFDCSAYVMVRVIRLLRERNASVAYPYIDEVSAAKMPRTSMMTLNSTYLKGVDDKCPKVGTGIWAPKKNYFLAYCKSVYGDIQTNLMVK